MYPRCLNRVYSPAYVGFTKIPIRSFKTYNNTKLTSRVTGSFGNDVRGGVTDHKRERDEIRREAITHLHFRPTFIQKILILKTRFFATGWILVVFLINTYLGLRFTRWFGNWTHRDRYSL